MFYAGSNIPGYLPMADEPNIFATFRDAKEWMLNELSFAADHDDERGDSLAAMAEDLDLYGSHGETGWGGIAYRVDDDGEVVDHDLGIAYWITWEATDCRECGQQATMVGEDPHTWETIPQCEACRDD